MKEYKEVNRLIKAYVCAVYRPDKKNAKSESEVKEFLDDFLSILKKYNIISDYNIEFREKYEEVEFIPVTLYYNLFEDTAFLIHMLF